MKSSTGNFSDRLIFIRFYLAGISFIYNFAYKYAVIAQLVEHQLPKLRVASSSLVYRSIEKADLV